MHLSSFRLFNYKSFVDSSSFELKQGINLIVGANNVGKSSLLDALTFKFKNEPHESPVSKPTKASTIYNSSVATFEVTLKPSEFEKILIEENSLAFKVPEQFTFPAEELFIDDVKQNEILNFLNERLKKNNKIIGTFDSNDQRIVELSLLIDEENGNLDQNWRIREAEGMRGYCLLAHALQNGRFNKILMQLGSGGLTKKRLNPFFSDIFKFNAKRIDVETSNPVDAIELESNCSNLAGVISNLAAEHPDMFREYTELVSSVIPSVKYIVSKRSPHPSGMGFEYLLKVSQFDSKLRREDLLKPLSSCGTGIGQVLGLLFVIVTSEYPRVILIDELQSFLHPGAVKRLLEIFNNCPVPHQYIITTHSPDVLNNSHPSNVILVDIDEGISKVNSINLTDSNNTQQVFKNLGMKLSDYYFKHHILWVEGDTEKGIVPLLFEERDDISVLVLDTGIAYKKRKESVRLACDLVNKLSVGENIPNRNVSIVFDKENLTDSQIAELQNIAKDLLHFLPRRMTENYLLHPKAVSELLNEIMEEVIVNEETTSQWFNKMLQEGWLNDKDKQIGISKDEWLIKVHGSNLLNRFFVEMTDAKCNYNQRKRKYGLELTQWILENNPDFLDELRGFYGKILNV